MSEMVERVTAALEASIRGQATDSYGHVSPHARGSLSVDAEIDVAELARAAILAMRDPSPEELKKMASPGFFVQAWRRAIDAVLRDE